MGLFLCDSNHGTFFYNQLSALQILVGDTTAAINSTKSYFAKQYQSQIDASGEQVCGKNRSRSCYARSLLE